MNLKTVLITASMAMGACGSADVKEPEILTASRSDSLGVATLTLSHALAQIGRGVVKANMLEPDIRIGRDSVLFGSVVDVASLGSGRFAVLDRIDDAVLLFDSTGTVVRRLGRPGRGPGEFQAPWAIAASRDKLVVWQDDPSTTFTVFDANGSAIAVRGATIDGDWGRPRSRWPLLNYLGPRDQIGPEDVTRRLAVMGDAGFVHVVQVNELHNLDPRAPASHPSPATYLVHYGWDAVVKDTLTVMSGPPTLVKSIRPGQSVLFHQPLYVGRPVWAIGDGWLAIGHGDSTTLTITRLTGDTIGLIRFPGQRETITMADRIHGAKWVNANQVLNSSTSREMLKSTPKRELARGIARDAREVFPYADRTPTIMAAYAVGHCLFLGGFAPADWADGTALTWLTINVATMSLESVFRIPYPNGTPLPLGVRGAAVREFDNQFVYTTHRDANGLFVVSRYRLPLSSCSRGPGTSTSKWRDE